MKELEKLSFFVIIFIFFFILYYIKKCKLIVFDKKNMNYFFENDLNLGDFSSVMFVLLFSFGVLFGRIFNI